MINQFIIIINIIIFGHQLNFNYLKILIMVKVNKIIIIMLEFEFNSYCILYNIKIKYIMVV